MKMNRKLAGLALALAVVLGGGIYGTIARADMLPDGTDLSALDLNGLWHTSWGSESCDLTLRQNGSAVTGSYVTTGAPPGTVSGVLQGTILTGSWSDSSSTGGFRMVFAPDGRNFVGTWGSGASFDDGGDWNGRR